MNPRRFVGAVLAPHHAENSQLSERWLPSAEQRFDSVVFVGRQPVVAQDFGSNTKGRRSGHVGKIYCRISGWRWVDESQKHFIAEIAENMMRRFLVFLCGLCALCGSKLLTTEGTEEHRGFGVAMESSRQ